MHRHYPQSTAKGSDVAWNRRKLKDAGKQPPEPKKAAAPKGGKAKGKKPAARKSPRKGKQEAEPAPAVEAVQPAPEGEPS